MSKNSEEREAIRAEIRGRLWSMRLAEQHGDDAKMLEVTEKILECATELKRHAEENGL